MAPPGGAMDTLPTKLSTKVSRHALRGLRAVHRHSVEAQNRPYPVSHPLACTHPETGRKALYLGPHLTKTIVGLESSESRRLLDLLFRHIELPRFVWTHHWQIDDLVIWDNRLHHAPPRRVSQPAAPSPQTNPDLQRPDAPRISQAQPAGRTRFMVGAPILVSRPPHPTVRIIRGKTADRFMKMNHE